MTLKYNFFKIIYNSRLYLFMIIVLTKKLNSVYKNHPTISNR